MEIGTQEKGKKAIRLQMEVSHQVMLRGEFTHGWRALGEERSPTHRKVPAFMMPERRGLEAQEDEEEVHRGSKEAGGTVPMDAEGQEAGGPWWRA